MIIITKQRKTMRFEKIEIKNEEKKLNSSSSIFLFTKISEIVRNKS